MVKVKCDRDTDGRIASEKVAPITTSDGVEEKFFLAPEQVSGHYAILPEVAVESGRVLFELPQESSSGRWRLWIDKDRVKAENDPA